MILIFEVFVATGFQCNVYEEIYWQCITSHHLLWWLSSKPIIQINYDWWCIDKHIASGFLLVSTHIVCKRSWDSNGIIKGYCHFDRSIGYFFLYHTVWVMHANASIVSNSSCANESHHTKELNPVIKIGISLITFPPMTEGKVLNVVFLSIVLYTGAYTTKKIKTQRLRILECLKYLEFNFRITKVIILMAYCTNYLLEMFLKSA